ncbi:MAG: hypothetical protein ABI337_07745 [Nitrososphaera sp.]
MKKAKDHTLDMSLSTCKSRRSFSNIPVESVLIGILYLIGLLCLYNDKKKGQRIIRKRGAIERLFDRIKDTFGLSVIPVCRYVNVSSYVLLCIFVYEISIYYNCIIGKTEPQYVKHMLGN